MGQSARSAQSRQNTWRFRVVSTESCLETERLPEATFVAPLRIWEVEPDSPAKNAAAFSMCSIAVDESPSHHQTPRKSACRKFAALTLAKRAIPIAVEHEGRRHGYVVADPWKCSSARTPNSITGQDPPTTGL